MNDTHLHVYRCRNCRTVATTAFKHVYGDPLRCNLCRCWMNFQYTTPITTPEQQALASRGVVYNPGATFQKREPIPCDNVGCRGFWSELYGYEIDGVGKFCSVRCLSQGSKRHEAAMNQKLENSVVGEKR